MNEPMSLTRTIAAAAALCLALLLAGCSTPAPSVKTEPTPAAPPAPAVAPAGPDITLTIASINLGGVSRRIEKADIESLCRWVQREKADVLAVQGLTRYPGVAARVDVFEEIAARTGMRSVFGETITLSGRQSGNALYSTYPIHSHEVKPYAGISSTGFEAALVGLIDAGAREIAVVSTLLPEKATAADRDACQTSLTLLRQTYAGTPMIVNGNLPAPSGAAGFRAAQPSGGAGRAWYTPAGLEPEETRTVDTELGRLLVTRFGVYRKDRP
jgi:endonuclease/exonuclease/phosphatase family metal-dependent hydrolase